MPHHQRVDLAAIANFRRQWPKIAQARTRYFKIHQQVLTVVNAYYSEYREAEAVVRLRRDIRMATKGTPVTIAQDAVTAAGYVSFGTEQLYNAQSQFVGAAYKKLVTLVHPDRPGGSLELFQLVNAAYHLRDLTYLQELYLQLTKNNVWWQSSADAIAYIEQEVQRPQVSLRLLQSTTEFEIARLHRIGRGLHARRLAHTRIKELVIVLTRELAYLQTKHDPLNPSPTGVEHGNDEEQGRFEEESGGSASFQEIHKSWNGSGQEGQRDQG